MICRRIANAGFAKFPRCPRCSLSSSPPRARGTLRTDTIRYGGAVAVAAIWKTVYPRLPTPPGAGSGSSARAFAADVKGLDSLIAGSTILLGGQQ